MSCKKRPIPTVLLICLLWLITACRDDSGRSSARDAGAEGFGVALLLTGSIDDHEWNQAGYEGLLRVERELGARIAYAADLRPDQHEAQFRRFAREGFDLVIGHGGEFIPAASMVADEFPNTAFAIIGGHPGNNRNFGAILVPGAEVGYLLGVVAGLGTRSGKVAYVSGVPYPHMLEQSNAFGPGVRSVAPRARVAVRWTQSWTDSEKARATARALIDAGFDVIVANVDHASHAVIDEVRRAGVRAIGMMRDQYPVAPEAVITSVIFHIDELIVRGATLVQKGRWEGRYYRFGFGDGALSLAPFRGHLTPEQVARVERVREDVVRGRLDVEVAPGLEVAP